MPTYNQSTTYLDSTNVLRGNAIISISDYVASPSYTEIGALTNVSIQRNIQTTEEQVDNAPGEQRIFKEDATIKFDFIEHLNTTVAEMMFGDSDTFANTAAAPVAGATQTIAANWTNQRFYPLEGQNSSGLVPTINTVTASVTGALSGNTATIDDYKMSRNSAGIWGIVLDTAGAAGVATTESIVIDYDYTPAASSKQTFGTGSTLSSFILKVAMRNNDGKEVIYTFYKCQIENIDALALNADDAEDARAVQPLTVTAKPDGLYKSDAVGEREIS